MERIFKNMNYGENIQKYELWREYSKINKSGEILKNQNKITKSSPDLLLNYLKGQEYELLKLPQIPELPKLPQIPEVPKLPQELEGNT